MLDINHLVDSARSVRTPGTRHTIRRNQLGNFMSERRRFYRKPLQSVGYLTEPDGEKQFLLRELSIKGCRAFFDEDPDMPVHRAVRFHLPELNIRGIAIVKWVAPTLHGGVHLGFEFNRILPTLITPRPTKGQAISSRRMKLTDGKAAIQDGIDVRRLLEILVELSNSMLTLATSGYRGAMEATQLQRDAVSDLLSHVHLSESDRVYVTEAMEEIRVLDGLIEEALRTAS